MSKFKIETVKWSWAKEVKNPNVYRDDEFVRAKSAEEALESIHFLMAQPSGLTYTITVKRDGEYFTYFRHNMPCLGGLVKYRDSHGPNYWMNPYFPCDIRVAFPEGEIIYIACFGDKETIQSKYGEFVFSEESPWRAAFNNKNTIIFKNGYFILTDMNTDPTVFYSLMRLGGIKGYGGQLQKDWHPKANLLFCKSASADPRRLAGQKPIKTSGGTWAEGYGYTRPYNESIFIEKIPTKFKDFGSLPTTGYPPGSDHSPNYLINTMKKEFGVDIPNANTYPPVAPDKKIHDALIKAWDYFKEESKNLKDE